MGTDNSNIARRYMNEVWAKGDPCAIEELVDRNIVIRDAMGGDIKGIAKVLEMVKLMRKSFSNNTFTIEEIIVAGDRAVLRHTWRGTHTGDFYGVAATGRVLTNPVVEILRIVNGKVIEDLGCMDSYAMFQQLGVLPERDKLVASRPSHLPTAPERPMPTSRL